MSEDADRKDDQWKRIVVTHVERIQELEKALSDAVSQVSSARKGSIGSIDSHYLPQIRVIDVLRWRAALAKEVV